MQRRVDLDWIRILAYEIVKRVAWLRPLFGLKPVSGGDGELGMQAAARGE